MFKQLNLLFISIFLMAASLQGAEPRPYSYLARKVPQGSADNCHSQAKLLAERFAKITGLSAKGSCYSIEPEGNDLLMKYQANEPLNVISSVPDLDFPGRGHEFSTQAECEAVVEREKSVFQNEIGSEPLLSFCRVRENYYGLQRWALVLEGFKNSKTELAWASSRVPGRPTKDQIEQLKVSVKDKFTRSGINVRFVFVQEDEKGQLRMNILYYGRYSEQLKGFTLASVNSLEECSQALRDFQQVDGAHPEMPSAATCIVNPYSRGVDLFVAVNVLNWFHLRQSAESFTDYSKCQSEKNQLLSLYQKEVSANILEGFCTEWGPTWKINFLEIPTTP